MHSTFNFNSNTKNQEKFYSKYVIPHQISRDVAVDLGSNVGFFVLDNWLSFKSIFAIDASYQNFCETLKKVLAMRIKYSDKHLVGTDGSAAVPGDQVACFNLAAAKNSGEIIKVFKHAWSAESVSCMTNKEMFHAQYKDWTEAREPFHNVFTISLEDLYKLFDVDYIDYLKIDIEGAEYDFLFGKDLSKIGAIGLELHGTFGQEKKNEMKEYLSKYFEIYDVQYDNDAPGHSVITYINKELA